jgi:hypothetical protein
MQIPRESPVSPASHFHCAAGQILLVHHVARRLRLSRRMVRHLAQKGKFPGHKHGPRIWHFRISDVEELQRIGIDDKDAGKGLRISDSH